MDDTHSTQIRHGFDRDSTQIRHIFDTCFCRGRGDEPIFCSPQEEKKRKRESSELAAAAAGGACSSRNGGFEEGSKRLFLSLFALPAKPHLTCWSCYRCLRTPTVAAAGIIRDQSPPQFPQTQQSSRCLRTSDDHASVSFGDI